MNPAVPIATACDALGVGRATLCRNTQPPAPPRVAQRAPSPRRIGDAERAAILEVFHSAEFGRKASGRT